MLGLGPARALARAPDGLADALPPAAGDGGELRRQQQRPLLQQLALAAAVGANGADCC